jgi:Zn-dependent protease with chaperone function
VLTRVRFRVAGIVLVLFLLTALSAAFARKKAPKLAETIDLPSSFDVDFQLAAKQRVELGSQKEVPDDVAGRVGADVFQSLIQTQMISGIGLPYSWRFRPIDSPVVNAFSLADGEVVAYAGLSRLIGANRGLWAAVLAHEVAHVSRRHVIKKVLFHEYIEEQVRYWQMRARMGDKAAGWTALAVRIAGNLAEKKLSRDLEHEADMQGMLLMARAGYHPDYAFAMHHLLRMNSPDRSKLGTFFFSDHPRWETRDQRTERAYTEALAEYNQLWARPETSPGGAPPAVAFLGEIRGTENKEGGTGDLSLALSCRNVGSPVALVVHLTRRDGTPVQSLVSDYRDSAGRVRIQERALCSDTEAARPTIVRIPTALIPGQDRKLKAQIEVIGPNDSALERSRVFDIHFPKTDKRATNVVARVRVEPAPGEVPGVEREDQYSAAEADAPVTIRAQQAKENVTLAATRVEPKVDVATATVAASTENFGGAVGTASVAVQPEPPTRNSPSDTSPHETLGVLPSALNGSGLPTNWGNSLVPASSATWWRVSTSIEPSLKIGVSRSVISFPVQPVDTESLPAIVIITNNSPAALTISRVTLAGADSSDFSQVSDCDHSIDAGATCTLSLMFKPTASGTRSALLTFAETSVRVVLTGIGK